MLGDASDPGTGGSGLADTFWDTSGDLDLGTAGGRVRVSSFPAFMALKSFPTGDFFPDGFSGLSLAPLL